MRKKKIANARNNCILSDRRKTHLVTLSPRLSAEQDNSKRAYEMARAVCPAPDPDNLMW